MIYSSLSSSKENIDYSLAQIKTDINVLSLRSSDFYSIVKQNYLLLQVTLIRFISKKDNISYQSHFMKINLNLSTLKLPKGS